MDGDTARQLRGTVELTADAVEAAVDAIAETHQALTRMVYAPFALLGPSAAPVAALEQLQMALTHQVYQAIALTSRVMAEGAVAMIERQADRE